MVKMKKNFKKKSQKISSKNVIWLLLCLVVIAIGIVLKWIQIQSKPPVQTPTFQAQNSSKMIKNQPQSDVDYSSSPVFDSVTFEYDATRFSIGKSTGSTLINNRGFNYPAWQILNKDGSVAASVSDLSGFDWDTVSHQMMLNVSSEYIGKSNLRDVVINEKKYAFSADVFGEGFPISDTCSQGGSVETNYFVIPEKKLGVKIVTATSEKFCEGQEDTITYTPDEETVESILKVIESMKFE
jgi:hypothetical protein